MRSEIVSAWDGLAMHVQEWGDDHGGLPPLLCLPGLVRTGEDFADFAACHAHRRRIVAIDYLGRGRSARARSYQRYLPEQCLRDVGDVCSALHLHRVIVVGTSYGGLLAMGLAATRPGLLAGVVLNDIGPDIGAAGEAFLRKFVADDPDLPDLDAATAHLRRLLPYLSLSGDAQWRRFARLTYSQGSDGHWHPHWDTRIAEMLEPPVRDLWPLFATLAGIPLLLIRGLHSNILLQETARRMQQQRPDMALVEIPNVGHAPTLAEPEAQAALHRFLEPA